MSVQIEKEFSIVAKETGRYHSFPTLVRSDDQLWMACRSGSVSDRQAHGLRGSVKLFASHLNCPDHWTLEGTLFDPQKDGSENELDAILSNPQPGLYFLATRDYQRDVRNDTYLSVGPTPFFNQRTPLATIADRSVICFGHLRKTVGGTLLMPGYSGFVDEPSGAPALLGSTDQGQTWKFRSKVASSTNVGTRLTEFSMGHLGDTSWIALIRSETPPFYLYHTMSEDNGRSWRVPERTCLCGHAPMILDDRASGRHLVLYRDLSRPDPGVALGLCDQNGNRWERAGRLASYRGSIYDGGYGDLLQLEKNRYLAVYYLCDADASPWIDGSIFSLGKTG